MDVVALKPVRYAGESHDEGDRFSVKDKDYRILHAIGKVKKAPRVQRKVVEPEAEDEKPKASRKRTYHRRDMKAVSE